MTFGNGTSTVRAFRRVSPSGAPPAPTASPVPSDPVTPPDSDAENRPPEPTPKAAPTPVSAPATKEAKLGRRLFARALAPSLEECLAQTSAGPQRALLAQAATALAARDASDPAGLCAVAKAVLARVEGDARLMAALKPQSTQAKGDATQAKPASSLRVAKKESNPSSPRLVLAGNNPHLQKELRRKQSVLSLEDRLPGREGQGVEEALYGRWREGLAQRWGT